VEARVIVQNSQASESELDRGAMRAAILTAARAVAERDGVDNLTLSKVAVEAGLPRAAVYRQFTRKEDLLMSIVSDDLATLARTMRGIDWPEGSETPESAVVLSLPRPAETAEPAETPAEAVDMAKGVSAAMSAPPEPAPVNERKLARRAELLRVLDAKNTVPSPADMKDEPTPDMPVVAEKAAPRADAWLERRLRVFEKGMAAMEARQDQVEKNARAVVATAEASIKALEETVKELAARADAADTRHKASSNEVRAALNETTLRIQTVEGVAKAALAENTVPEAALDMAPEPIAHIVHEDVVEEPEASAEEPAAPDSAMVASAEPKAEAPKSKIMEVRASVAAATAAAAVSAEARKDAQAVRAKRDRTRFMLAGLIVLAVFIAAATVAFSKGVADGRFDALHHFNRPLAQSLTPMATTPLDQLTARAQAGDATAEYVVAAKYLHGDGTAKNAPEAMHWLTLAAAKGLPIAQYTLGTLYTDGLGTKADTAKALQWYEAAALQGNRKAMHGLAIAYAQGSGTAQNMPEAVRWFSRAAQLGYVDSQFNLAVLYERGDGVPQSLLDAYKWYLIASRNGDAEAKERVDTLKTQLNADDLAAAEHAAGAFQPAPFNVAANSAP
jgi:TPR repeat protein